MLPAPPASPEAHWFVPHPSVLGRSPHVPSRCGAVPTMGAVFGSTTQPRQPTYTLRHGSSFRAARRVAPTAAPEQKGAQLSLLQRRGCALCVPRCGVKYFFVFLRVAVLLSVVARAVQAVPPGGVRVLPTLSCPRPSVLSGWVPAVPIHSNCSTVNFSSGTHTACISSSSVVMVGRICGFLPVGCTDPCFVSSVGSVLELSPFHIAI